MSNLIEPPADCATSNEQLANQIEGLLRECPPDEKHEFAEPKIVMYRCEWVRVVEALRLATPA